MEEKVGLLFFSWLSYFRRRDYRSDSLAGWLFMNAKCRIGHQF
jgi:hypothetical protein